MPPVARIALSLLSIAAWMVLLFSGWAFGGAVHLLLAASLLLFPWRQIPGPNPPGPESGEDL